MEGHKIFGKFARQKNWHGGQPLKQISILLPVGTADALKQFAKIQGRSTRDVIDTAIIAELRREGFIND